MNDIELPSKLVTSVLTVLRTQSFTRAAQSLGLSQPAVSQHISRLEDVLGFELFERSRGVVLPTAKAKLLIPDLERLEQSNRLIIEKAKSLAKQDKHIVQIASTTSLVAYVLGPILMNYQKGEKKIHPIFKEVDDHRVYEMVLEGEVDFALTSIDGSDVDLSQTLLFKDRPCIVLPEDHPLCRKKFVSLEDIIPLPIIRPPVNTAASRILEGLVRQTGHSINFTAEAMRLHTIEYLVRCGFGYMVSSALACKIIAHSGLKVMPIDTEFGWRKVQLIRPLRTQPSTITKEITLHITQHVQQMIKDEPLLIEKPHG